jgi:mRNA interferase MazF
MTVDFDRWNFIKQNVDAERKLPTFNEREIWWCSIGMNIGFEIYGKGEKFWRPVLILDKHNRHTFLGLPLGSTLRPGNRYYVELNFRGRVGSVMLSQARTFSSKRLSNRMGTLAENKFEEIREAYIHSLKT